MSGSFDSRSSRSETSPSNCRPTASTWGASAASSSAAAIPSVEPRDRVERRGISRQPMLLPVVDHLDAMLGGAKRAIGIADRAGDIRLQPPGPGQRGQRIERRGGAQLGFAAAVDQLLRPG